MSRISPSSSLHGIAASKHSSVLSRQNEGEELLISFRSYCPQPIFLVFGLPSIPAWMFLSNGSSVTKIM